MEIRHRTSGTIDILELEGRFDAYEVPAVVKWFDNHPDASRIIVNMSGVSFIDSSGLSTLVKGLKLCRQNGGDLVLAEIQPSVRSIFELTRLDKAFTLFDDEQSALDAQQS